MRKKEKGKSDLEAGIDAADIQQLVIALTARRTGAGGQPSQHQQQEQPSLHVPGNITSVRT